MRRQRFSERNGIVQPRNALQINSMDGKLKTRLWNCFRNNLIEKIERKKHLPDYINWEADREFFCYMWDEFFYQNNNPGVQINYILKQIETWWLNARWNEIYDFIEFVCNKYYRDNTVMAYTEKINEVLEQEMSGYRIIDGLVTQITDELEIMAIENAIESPYKNINQHLSCALEMLSDRDNPDYRNSIKESISAVEALCQQITGDPKATLGKALKALNLHSALDKGFQSIYGWTSDAEGIRHSLSEDDKGVSFEEAKYMLVSCSAFINYLIGKQK